MRARRYPSVLQRECHLFSFSRTAQQLRTLLDNAPTELKLLRPLTFFVTTVFLALKDLSNRISNYSESYQSS